LAIQDLKQADDREGRARLWVARGRWPQARPHELLPPFDPAIAVAEVEVDVVDAGDVNDHEIFVGLHWVLAASARWMTQLYDKVQLLERPPLKKNAVPFLRVLC
jgi:hypothetical protein